ncbi:protocadherin Fat 3-like [Plodia interpunctella]|uniref:protocadherin Fat 3-like n=1 Tax=Plodia interpunctella TaxID=58824 RepID=UPI002367D1C9|nr:protocadherin Fat 3-like [Plodia interpunctella]
MENNIRHAAFALLLLATLIPYAQSSQCSWMTEIPRPDRPEIPIPDSTDVPWSQRPLFPVTPEREEVCVDIYPMEDGAPVQVIYMDEEIDGDVYIARLNYEGSADIEIVFLSGSYALLGPVIRRDENNILHLVITEKQDYETPGMQLYMFYIRVAGETVVADITLVIVNIDDNDPIIHVFQACELEELGEPHLTECVYEVTDADGAISTRFMTFTINSNRPDDESIFCIQSEVIPTDVYRMTMTIGITRALNFETTELHVFNITALDSLPNTHTVTLLVQVINVESRPPRWMEIFAVQQFDEKTNQTFTVMAIDGDRGIDKPINYTLRAAPEDDFFSIETIDGGRNGSYFYVSEIDRDTLEREIFQVTLVAYKADNASFSTDYNVVIIVNDINDQRPEPFQDEYHIEIMEETAQTLTFNEEVGFHDRDLGENAQYRLYIEDVEPPGAASAFYIAPEVGYQRQTFIMGTRNHSMLDYEVEEFQHVIVRVVAVDMNRTDFRGNFTVHIDLINWNDEEPIFEETTQTVVFDETEGEGFYVATVLAVDRDIDDRVEHVLLGNAGDYLTIEENSGRIYVTANDSFDYHRQSELFVQVRATDTLGAPFHTATAQLVIQLNDINNTPPTLRLARGSPNVEENVPQGYEIEWDIRATDPDTTAELHFEIDWETSYATKQGRETNPIEFHDCLEIETYYPDEGNLGSAAGRLIVKEIRHNVTIDYEEFEVLYLTVRVRDVKTVLGDDSDESTLTITIIDMNDNWPIWAEGTLSQEFRVTEMAAAGTVIGSVLATDIDGPLYNQVRYTIYPTSTTDEEEVPTPENLVQIDFYTGQITVAQGAAIDADVPPRHYLNYTVIASDRCYAENTTECPDDPTYWNTDGEISIRIIDTNNKIPVAETSQFNETVWIYENATSGDTVVQLVSSDLDRDEIYYTVSYQINYGVAPRLRDFFAVDLNTGLVYVEYTTGETLDRDGDEPQHEIFLTLTDNFLTDGDGRRNQAEQRVLVVLLDVNDNAPELPAPAQLAWDESEGAAQATPLNGWIFARDRDEPCTDNSRVGYSINTLAVINRDLDVPQNMFYMETNCDEITCECRGRLWTNIDLRGYWGTYDINIIAFDHGDPPLSSNETYELVVRPYNYHSPVFVFPRQDSIIRLAREWAVVNGMLAMVSGDILERVSATDEDGLHAGVVTFAVTGNTEASEYFDVLNEGDNAGTLRLIQALDDDVLRPREFQVTITATDGGTEPGPLSTTTSVRLVFVPTQANPVFSDETATVAFMEGEQGLTERFELPKADDPKNYGCDGDCHVIYYRIVEGNDEGFFVLDQLTNEIYLASELDHNTSSSHVLMVAASNSPLASPVISGSTIAVHVVVREADPRPFFLRNLYTAGISSSDTINKEVLRVEADHSEGDALTYTIDRDSMVVDPSLNAVRDSAFILNPASGVLTLNMQPSNSMHGMFEFDIIANDTAGATASTEVKVYLISSLNRVFFTFENTLEEVETHADFIAETFSTGFVMTCNIDQIVPASDSSGVALDDLTSVHAHFIRDDVPVSTDEIELLRSDTLLLLAIRQILQREDLFLQDLVTDISPEPADPNLTTVYVLAALAALLGFLCLVLLLTFIVRTRALNRRLQALSMTKYGSVDSGLNRAGLAPGTNKHATEGSNPIWNEAIRAPDFDTVSDISGDSDLIGVEDLAQFNENYIPPGDNNSVEDITPTNDSVATHGNQFRFNASPFSPGFSQSNFRS